MSQPKFWKDPMFVVTAIGSAAAILAIPGLLEFLRKVQIPEKLGSLLIAALFGIALPLIGAALRKGGEISIRRVLVSNKDRCDLKITDCKLEDLDRNGYRISGTISALPDNGLRAWLLTSNIERNGYWPQQEVIFTSKEWTSKGWLGKGATDKDETRYLVLVLAWESSQMLYDYSTSVVDKNNADRRVPITRFPPDSIECDSKEVIKHRSRSESQNKK